jgi:hypothetical protein
MATVAAIALAVPAAAQDQAKPLEAEPQQAEQAQQPVPEPSGDAAETAAPEAEQAAQPPATAEEQPPVTGEQGLAGAEVEPKPPAEMTFIEVQDEAQFLADEEVIGKDVVNVMDEDVGTIADLVMDQDQKLVGVVLSVGGFLGIGDKWVAIPVDQIDFPTNDQPARLLVAVTEEQLKNAPDFMTRAAVEAEEEAAQAQQQALEQQQQIPSPATTSQ